MRPRRTALTTVLVLLALAAGAGVANASSTADATQTTDANLTTFVAPGDTLEALRDGTVSDVLTRRQRVALSDTLVVRVSTPNLGAAVADQPGNTTTERFRALLSGPDTKLTAVEITSGDGPPRAIDLTVEQLVVHRVGADTFDLIYDTGRLRATDDTNGNGLADDGPGTAITPVRVFEFEFTHDGVAARSSLGIFPAAISFSTPPNDGLVLYPLPDQRLVGRTPLAPGTTLTISLDGVGHPFEVERTTTVTGRQQSFANLSLDLTDAPEGVPLAVTATSDGQRLGEMRGQLAELTASFTPVRADAPRTRLRLRNVSLSSGGFLVVRNGPDGSIVATRYVAAGEYDTLTIQYRRAVTADSVVVTAYVDVDGDRLFEADDPDRPFRRDGEPVSTVVDLEESTPTTPSTRTETLTTAAPTTDTRTTAPSSPTATGTPTRTRLTDASGDGFGPGVALAALVIGLAALARRD